MVGRTLAILALGSGCTAVEGAFGGELDGTDAVVGVVVTDEGVGKAYVCGGDETRDSHTRWFDLTAKGEGFGGDLDGWGIEMTATGTVMDGSVTDPDGATMPFVLGAAASEEDGLYSADEGECLSGVVVFGGTMQGAFCLPGGLSAQVVPVGQILLEDGGIRVRVDGGEDEFMVLPVQP